MPMYHFRLPSGEEYASESVAKIRKQYPDATITGRVEVDDAGNSTLKPYSGEQPVERSANAPESENAAPEGGEPVTTDGTPVDGDANAPEAEKPAARPKASRK